MVAIPQILVVDDDPGVVGVLSALLKSEGYQVVCALGGEKAKEYLASGDFDLMISDIRMSPVDGLELLQIAHAEKPAMAAIMLTAFGSVETAIEALKFGAFDYITKPFKVDELLITVQRAMEHSRMVNENAELRAQLGMRYQLDNIVAESPQMQNVCEMIKKVAPTDTTVLIMGESGAGKKLVAKAIHNHSRRKEKVFLPVNCAALPESPLESEMFGHVKGAFAGAISDKEGVFEAASGGTLFLDEVGSMPLSIQGKLLRVLQDKGIRRAGSHTSIPVDVRVLAATNVNLETLMELGKFREDLYYALNVIPLEIVPLRERPEDILPIAYQFIRKETGSTDPQPTYSIMSDVCAVLESYAWPGNVRELENVIKHALAFAKDHRITKSVLPPKIAAAHIWPVGRSANAELNASKYKSLKAFLRSKEKEYLAQVLSHTDGDKERAAKALKISLATLYRKLPSSE